MSPARPRPSRKPPSPRESVDPYLALKADDYVCLSSPLVSPVHWQDGQVLWRDDKEILVRTTNFASRYEKHLHDIGHVRVFGTREHCAVAQKRAADAVRDAERMSHEVEDMAAELRRRMVDLFETVAAAALKACGTEPTGAAP